MMYKRKKNMIKIDEDLKIREKGRGKNYPQSLQALEITFFGPLCGYFILFLC